jgi:hypothetical protein
MVKHDKVAPTVFLVVAGLLFVLAFRPELRSSISDFVLFDVLSVFLAFGGIYHIATARSRAERHSQQLRGASPIRRLWLPARVYTSTSLLWQLRIGGSMSLLGAVIFALAAFVAYRRGW